ncbi:LacI family DNA-binding transcriptional regulator [Glaciibacter psychrotolerans]|uniref:DNA-binding LacI/PurR family transcriptional regulator n=1 Tax=Glaciibacter psychrotolerans TaxID=670054 RepID=A0A7Z0EGB3_9MICO|nr:LacI family DNA-binding transcriptional regulator [Leifsonia psychrotolerans]NYJ21131.1 DNA-binding LacI/PurR family transcriptional regulator [Leifsonia psychrotolerans]
MSTASGRRKVTIHDVARQAGVSITTVSHSLNGKGVVAEETRARVHEVATKLGYSADAIARGLRSSRLGVLGLVIRPLDSLDSYQPIGVDYFMRFAGAAAVEALDRGFGLMLVRDPTTHSVPAIALAVDGFIISDPIANDPVIDLLNRHGIPLVAVGRDIDRPEFTDWLGEDTSQDTRTVIEHLSAHGARSIALVRGTDANSWNADSESAYRHWAAECGQPAAVYLEDERSGEDGGRAVAELMLASPTGVPDAIYCLTGRHAAGLQKRLVEQGHRVPIDVMIVAGADSEQTRNATPPITSIDLTPESTAKAAVTQLLQLLSDTPTAEHVRPSITNILRIRESTARV